MLALPAGTGLCGKRLFHQGCRIDKHLHRRAASRRELAGKLFQPALDHLVIVTATCIDRHIAMTGRREIVHGVMIGAIIHRQDNGASGLRPHGARSGAAVSRVGKPPHISVMPAGDKRTEPAGNLRRQSGGGHMDTGEPSLGGSGIKPAAKLVAGPTHQPTGSISPSAWLAWNSASNSAKVPASMAARMPAIRS